MYVQPSLNIPFRQLTKYEKNFFSQTRYFYISKYISLFLLIIVYGSEGGNKTQGRWKQNTDRWK